MTREDLALLESTGAINISLARCIFVQVHGQLTPSCVSPYATWLVEDPLMRTRRAVVRGIRPRPQRARYRADESTALPHGQFLTREAACLLAGGGRIASNETPACQTVRPLGWKPQRSPSGVPSSRRKAGSLPAPMVPRALARHSLGSPERYSPESPHRPRGRGRRQGQAMPGAIGWAKATSPTDDRGRR